MARLLTLLFSHFFVKTLSFQKPHSPCRKKRIFEKQKNTTKNNKKQMARLLTYDGQVIDPTADIYIYMALVRFLHTNAVTPVSPFWFVFWVC